ncbi:MAG TPA: acyl-CoA dehydrogenase family protein [Candidatus Dormibacteraeota bacterium]|nr:acyl-CoA dehydrogenase family protein [Candidatus Dormibacteraeota bacterium]
MDFGLSEDQLLLKDTIRRFLAEQCPTTRVRQIMEGDAGLARRLWTQLAELGVAGVIAPATHGGLERELLDLALVAEELGYACAPGPFLGCAMATVALNEGGDQALQDQWLPKLAAGEAVATVAWGEENGEWTPTALHAQAAGGRLSGRKLLVPSAQIADLFVVAARDEHGPHLFAVERDDPGVDVTPMTVNDLTRPLDVVAFTDAHATKLPHPAAVQRTMDAGLILLAADAYGGSRRCLEMACSYALTREQFGQPIAGFQAVKHQLANMAADLEPSLALVWYAAHAFDRIQDQSTRHAAMVKAHMSDLYDRVTRDATELHGGIGFTWEFDLHLWFRRALFDRSVLGEAIYHRARAAELAGW